MEYLFDMTLYPVIEKPLKSFEIAEFLKACEQYGGLLNVTMAGELVQRPKQHISLLVQTGKVKHIEISGRKFVVVDSLKEWKQKLDKKKSHDTSNNS